MNAVDFQWDVRSAAPEGAGVRQAPGMELFGYLTVTPDGEIPCNRLLIRLEWNTDGRGVQDSGVAVEADIFQGTLPAGQPSVFAFRLAAPDQPWSYSGRFINILWNLTAEIDQPLAINPKSSYPLILRPGVA
jgi:hypothetical protein